jgi:Terminase large subunit, T4likevirus-type, N-terminal
MKASINEDFAFALDPVLFARRAGIDPDKWQEKLLLSAEKRIILNCCRQSGKSTIVALLSLHHALNYERALVLVLSPSLRQSTELFKKIIIFYQALECPLPAKVQTSLALELANGSRVLSLPDKEQTVRGFSSASLIVIDEAARVSDELYYAVQPMLAVSRGGLILLSTPNGKQGFFYEVWQNEDKWLKVEVNAEECPRITSEYLADERRNYPSRFFQQEYYCEFHEQITSVFRHDDIDRAFVDRRGRHLHF